jgi:hypothetical protein
MTFNIIPFALNSVQFLELVQILNGTNRDTAQNGDVRRRFMHEKEHRLKLS